MPDIAFICAECDNEFSLKPSRARDRLKKTQTPCCSLSCSNKLKAKRGLMFKPGTTERFSGSESINEAGNTYGSLKVLRRTVNKGQKGNDAYWDCECSCGNIISVRGQCLRKGQESCRFCAKLQPVYYKVYLRYKKHAKRGFDLTFEQAAVLFASKCFYCGRRGVNKASHGTRVLRYNGIDRKDSKKGYKPDNCVSCCGPCNWAKKQMTVEEFSQWLDAVSAHKHFWSTNANSSKPAVPNSNSTGPNHSPVSGGDGESNNGNGLHLRLFERSLREPKRIRQSDYFQLAARIGQTA